MGAGELVTEPDQRGTVPLYEVVTEVLLECRGLNMGMSLQRYLDENGVADEVKLGEIGEVMRGLRHDVGTVKDAVQALVQAYKTGLSMEPIKVLALRQPSNGWKSTGWVIDGAIRVRAALEAGVAEIPAQLVAPHFPDTPLEGMFLHYNARQGTRLTMTERNAILRVLARRFMRDHAEERDAAKFGHWLSQRTGLPSALIAGIVRNDFQVRTPDKWAEAERRLRAGESPAKIAKDQGISRTALEKQAKKLGIDLPGKKKVRQAGGQADLNGETPDATGGRKHRSQFVVIDARATARDLHAALKPVAAGLDNVFHQINDWVLNEAPEYRFEQAKMVWDVVDRLWDCLFELNRASKIYRDRHLAERDRPRLKQALSEAEAALAIPARRRKTGASRRGRAG